MTLKIVFPNQLPSTGNKKWIPLRQLSDSMTVDTQIAYFLISILHLLIYFSIVFYVMIYLLNFDKNISSMEYFSQLLDWAMRNNVVSFGNTLGIASIVITLISITYPAQMKLYTKAVEAHEKLTE